MGTKLSDYLARSKAADTAEDAALREAFASGMTAKTEQEFPNAWTGRARSLLEEAVALLDSRENVLERVEIAALCLRAEAGELPPDDLASLEHYFAEPACICPSDLRARGGYCGGCPAEH